MKAKKSGPKKRTVTRYCRAHHRMGSKAWKKCIATGAKGRLPKSRRRA